MEEEADHNEHHHHHNSNELYSGIPETDWATVHIVAICVILISLAGSSYVIYQSVKWRKIMLTTTQRIPLFIALSDATFGLLHGLDHTVSLSTGYVSPEPLCRFLGSGTIFAMNATALWVAAAAFYFWIMVVHNRVIDLGKFDWKLFFWGWGVPLVWGIAPHITNEYGAEQMWCGTEDNQLLWSGPIILLCLVMSAFFYGSLAWFLYQHRRTMKKFVGGLSGEKKENNSTAFLTAGRSTPKLLEENKPTTSDDRIAKLIRDLPVLGIVSIVQWTPYIAHLLLLVFQEDEFSLDVLVALTTNTRGIANAFAFRHMNMTGAMGREAATVPNTANQRTRAELYPHPLTNADKLGSAEPC